MSNPTADPATARNIGVTGASGFVGRYVVNTLAAQGHAVRAIARCEPQNLERSVTWARSPDLTTPGDWATVVAGLDVVIHAAARVHVMNDKVAEPLPAFQAANVNGTLALARAAAAQGVRRFVFVSSIKVNGERTEPGAPFTPDSQPAPIDPYGVSKLEAEQALTLLCAETGMELVIVRPVLVYGPGVKANFRALLNAVARGIPLPFGRVENARSLVFVGNLADLIARAALHPAAAGGTFLVSDGQDLSTAALIGEIARAMGRPARLISVPPAWLRGAGRLLGRRAAIDRLLGSLTVDSGSLHATLGWTPPFSVRQGLQATVARPGAAPLQPGTVAT